MLYCKTLLTSERRVVEDLLKVALPSICLVPLALLVNVASLDVSFALTLHKLVECSLSIADHAAARLLVGLVGVSRISLFEFFQICLELFLTDELLVMQVIEDSKILVILLLDAIQFMGKLLCLRVTE